MYLEFDGFSKSQPEKCNKDRHFVIIDSRIRFYTSFSVSKTLAFPKNVLWNTKQKRVTVNKLFYKNCCSRGGWVLPNASDVT